MSDFSTLNESGLHKSLKIFYAENFGGKCEVQIEGFVCDVACPKKTVIEIQTKNASALQKKIRALLSLGYKVILVRPIVQKKVISTFSQDGTLLRRKKSPKKESVHSILRDLTGLCDILLEKKFLLLCPKISVEESRVQTESPEQSKNRRRRFKLNWHKSGKSLLSFDEEVALKGKKSYLKLLPKNLPKEFSSKEVKAAFSEQKNLDAASHANLLLWVLKKMNLIEKTCEKERRIYYKVASKK